MIQPLKSTADAAALVLFCLALAACAPSHAAPAAQGPEFVTLSDPGFIQQWNYQIRLTGGESVKAISLVGDNLHIMTDQNIDHALTASGGELLYFNQIAPPGTPVMGPPVLLDNGVAYVTSHSLEIYNEHGRLQRSIPCDEGATSPGAAGPDNTVFMGVAELNGRLRCIDISRDANPTVWDVLTGGRVDGAPATLEKEIYCGSEDGSVIGVDSDGNTLWPLLDDYKFKTGGPIVADIKADKSGVYAVSGDQSLYCIDRASGRIKWRYFAGTPLLTAPAVTSTTVYLYVPGKGLAAIDKNEPITLDSQPGKLMGEEPIHSARWFAPDALAFVAQDDQYVYAQSDSNSLLALDKQTGQVVFTSRRHDLTAFAVNMKDSTIYAATADGEVMSIRADLTPGTIGELVWATPEQR
ncbi:MAG: PQQ-binding-like beta-propeller repeat protein [Tepidisphaeraceae bacterium]